MRLLLINKNPVVSRMMQMSVPKAGFDIEECDSIYDLPTGKYEVVVLDDEMYDENFLHDIQQNIKYHQIGIITTSKSADFSNFDFILTKPFLPTDLIEILRKVKTEIESQEEILPINGPQHEEGNQLFDSFLKGETSPFTEEERIVEIEEPQEESPFVEEPLEKAGVLKDEEVEEVSELLKEPIEHEESLVMTHEEMTQEDGEEVESFFAQTTQEEPLAEITEPQKIEPLHESVSLKPLTPEDLLTEVEEKTLQGEEQEEVRNESEVRESETSLYDLKRELQKLDVKGLREILDGMQLEITIKISYPDRKDV